LSCLYSEAENAFIVQHLSPDLEALIRARNAHPHSVLGMHPVRLKSQAALVVRAFLPGVERCDVVEVETDKRWPLKRVAMEGLYEGQIKGRKEVFKYRLRVAYANGEIRQFFDPYAFLPTLSEDDLYLFNQGNDHYIYRKLGAHLREISGVPGVSFALWAPNAKRVSVVGDFNHWDGRIHPLRRLGNSGVWELFLPGLEQDHLYKFELVAADGSIQLKTDPYGTYFESPPNNASVIKGVDAGYVWNDQDWIEKRSKVSRGERPISVYEVHFGSWKRLTEDNNRPLNYREMAPILADHVIEMGFTHVELMPLAEHPFDGSWGYQVTGFFAPTHRFGSPDDFKYFVDYLHQKDIGVILDWVPAHFPRDSFALAQFDGTHLFEHSDPREGAHQDWGTLIFNYGRHEVRSFLVANALAWLDRYHIDGLRVDAVASMLYRDYSREEGQWIPNKYGGRENLEAIEFLKEVNQLVHHYHPGVLMIAEESTAFAGVSKPVKEGGLGFDFKWNMGWMNDTLSYFEKDPIHRKHHHNKLTFGMLYQYAEHFILVFSHDEVTHGKGSMLLKMGGGTISEKAHNLRALYGFKWAWPGKKLLFMGSEIAQSAEWDHAKSLDWHLLQYMDHEGVRRLVRDLNHLYRSQPALYGTDLNPEGFRWINCNDAAASVLSFIRQDPETGETLAIIGNFTPVRREGYRLGLSKPGQWQEIMNTDATLYGGSNAGNAGLVTAEDIRCDDLPYSAKITVPPMGVVYFKWSGPGPA
jgi:1,4-alpha-glucan branching enzyme